MCDLCELFTVAFTSCQVKFSTDVTGLALKNTIHFFFHTGTYEKQVAYIFLWHGSCRLGLSGGRVNTTPLWAIASILFPGISALMAAASSEWQWTEHSLNCLLCRILMSNIWQLCPSHQIPSHSNTCETFWSANCNSTFHLHPQTATRMEFLMREIKWQKVCVGRGENPLTVLAVSTTPSLYQDMLFLFPSTGGLLAEFKTAANGVLLALLA